MSVCVLKAATLCPSVLCSETPGDDSSSIAGSLQAESSVGVADDASDILVQGGGVLLLLLLLLLLSCDCHATCRVRRGGVA